MTSILFQTKKRIFVGKSDYIRIMADNYLERQREDYEARKAAWEKERKYGKKKTLLPGKPKQTDNANVVQSSTVSSGKDSGTETQTKI